MKTAAMANPRPAALPHGDGPRVEKHGLHIEDHEEHGHEVELRRHPQLCTAHGDRTRLERLLLGASMIAAAEQVGGAEHETHEPERGNDVDREAPILRRDAM